MEEMRCGLCWGSEPALWLGVGALNRLQWLGGSPDPQASLLGQTPVLPKHPVLGCPQ